MSKCHLYCLEYFYMKIKFHWDKQATPAFILQKCKLVFQWKSNGKLSSVLIYVLPKGKGVGES